ncbi:MAG TPA: UDP-glucose/GDP-mannose dehydrogenase family protein [Candidatus Angelobacter sp.]|nr:UDP-glucose/GDP-mannose dehydrogenase family protein [Candidatus Angelobacter sp.]
MQVAVVGSGYVGLVVAACFADLGHKVRCVDQDQAKIAALNAGENLIHEEFLPELLRRHRGRNLTFSTDLLGAVKESLVIVIAVGTPAAADGEADLSYVESVTREIAHSADGYKLIVEKSTVPVYTNAWIHRAMVLNGCHDFDVASNPEFLREGTAVTDFLYPDRIVAGIGNEKAAAILRELYGPLRDGSYAQRDGAVPPPDGCTVPPIYLETSPQSAELIKHASNAFLAMKISFINAVASMCEAAGADIEDVRKGLGSDSRIGSRFLRAGIGYGGSCFPKDVAAFRAVARELGCQFSLLDEVHRVNEEQRQRFLKKVKAALWTLKSKRLAVLGLAFKEGTDDVRESPAIYVVQSLLKEGCEIAVYDPAAMQRAGEVLGDSVTYAKDSYAAMEGADALLILTEWREFAGLNLAQVRASLRYPIVLDGRNLYSPEAMTNAGLNYYSVGRSSHQTVPSVVVPVKSAG